MKTVANKTISFDQVMKVFKKYVATNDFRKILQNVHFDGQYLIATNSHVLLRVNKNYISDIPDNMQEGSLFDPKKMEFVSNSLHSYPETNRLIPNYHNSLVTLNTSNTKELHKHIKEAKTLVKRKRNQLAKIEITNENTNIYAHDIDKEGNEVEYNECIESVFTNDEKISFHVNSKYMDDILMTVKKLSKLNQNETEFKFISRLRPIHISHQEVFDIVVLPVRVY
jgi:hypothetical protein